MTTPDPIPLVQDYESSHRHPVNRALHVIGIPLVVISVVALVAPRRPFGWSRKASLGCFAAGWILLLAGHAIEGNRPLILKNPLTAMAGALAWWARTWAHRPF